MNILQYIKTLIAPPLVMPDTTKVWGIDVSHWNPAPVDFQRMKDLYHLDFVIIKGCDGTIKARYFDENVASAKSAGLPWMIYNWLYPNNKVSVIAQAQAWRALEVASVPPMGISIDCEWTTYNGTPANPLTIDLRLAHDKYFALSGSHATTYTAAGYANSYLKGFDWSLEPLWIANYGVTSPALPIGATTYQFWQFASTLDGWQLDPTGNQKLDGNYFNGTHAEFAAKYGAVIPPTGEPLMTIFDIKGAMNIRAAASITSTDVGDLFIGDRVEVTVVQISATDKWGKLSKITRAGANVALPVAVCYVSLNTTGTVEYIPPIADSITMDITLHDVKVAGDVYTAVGVKANKTG
jgi:GH25 family lysozyme M1 (1,4-beta-N-acetylmuramidase)